MAVRESLARLEVKLASQGLAGATRSGKRTWMSYHIKATMRYFDFPTFFVTLIACLAILFIFVSLRLELPLDCDFEKKSRRQVLDTAKTGDVLAVAYGSMRAKLVKVFTGSMWAHSCVIVRSPKGGEPFVLEVARYSRDKRGIMVTTLKSWLRRNKDYIVALAPYQGPAISDEAVKRFLGTHEQVREEMFVAKWFAAMVKRRHPGRINVSKKFFCSELVAHFLQETGTMKKKYHPSGYKPWELLYGAKASFNAGRSYQRPVLVISKRTKNIGITS